MAVLVEKFALGWHQQTGGAYRIKVINGDWSNWITVQPAELAAVALLFQESPVYVHPNGSITTGEEPIGE